jgi:hypothetical protein
MLRTREFEPDSQFEFRKRKISVRPVKLVLQSAGDSALPPRVAEPRAPGVFATLVVQLPSMCTGGALVTRFHEVETVHGFGQASGQASFACHFAMFYADLEHEMRPIESGHRLVLLCDVAWADVAASAAFSTAATGRPNHALVEALTAWPNGLSFVAVLLDNKYKNVTSIAALKGEDAKRGQFVLEALRKLPAQSSIRLFLCNSENQFSICGGALRRTI